MMQFSEVLTFGLLTLALLALWWPERLHWPLQPWQGLGVLALGSGLAFGHVQLLALPFLLIFAGACYLLERQDAPAGLRVVAGLAVIGLTVGFTLHVIPGFLNPTVIDSVILSEGGIPFTKALNFDKAFAGLCLLGFGHRRVTTRRDWLAMLKAAAPVAGVTLITVLLLSYLLGYVRLDLKWSPLFAVWAWTNLFFTCIAEEALFRGVIQRYLHHLFRRISFGPILGLALASLLFGLAHLAGGPKYVLLATVAGFGYGFSYQRSSHIEASILTHFLLNTIHFLCFTYPALASAL